MEKYKVFLGGDIAKTYSDAKKFTLERVNSFSDNSYLVLFQRIKLIDEFRGDVFFSIGLLDDYHRALASIVRTPTTHPDDFLRKKDSQGRTIFVNKYTNEIWSKSNTSHSDKTGEWKVGIGNKEPNKNSKITIGISNGKIIKVNK